MANYAGADIRFIGREGKEKNKGICGRYFHVPGVQILSV
jgi:hypothetical protein